MGYGTDGLTFNVLREANRRRQQEWPGNEKADVAFSAIEVAGEAGEVSEAVKKFLRAERGIKGSTATKEDIAAEMGDLLVSLDLLADRLGIDLGEAVRRKFNATSEKYGMRTYLSATDWHLKPVDAICEQDLGRKVSSVAAKILKGHMPNGNPEFGRQFQAHQIQHEAADEIERLQGVIAEKDKRIAELEAALRGASAL